MIEQKKNALTAGTVQGAQKTTLPANSNVKPDLKEARRLLDAGLKLVRLNDMSKRPVGNNWNSLDACVKSIDEEATGYGVPLVLNKACSVDPDNVDLAIKGMAALGFDLEKIMADGVRTTSTRPGSGGRAAFAEEPDLAWIKFASRDPSIGTVLELRAGSPNLQDCCPGVVYLGKNGDGPYTQKYANKNRWDDLPGLPDDLLTFWQRCSTNPDFLHEAQTQFMEAVGAPAVKSCSTGRTGTTLAYSAPGYRSKFNAKHKVEDFLNRHGYNWHQREQRWSCPTATGAPGIRPIPGKDDLWQSDHASDPLSGTFDAWACFVVLDHDGDLDAAIKAVIDAELRQSKTASKILDAIAYGLIMEPDEVAGIIQFKPSKVEEIVAATGWHPDKRKFFVVKDGLKLASPDEFGPFTRELFGSFYKCEELEKLAANKCLHLSEAQTQKFVSGIVSIGNRKLMEQIKLHKQFNVVDLHVDPFAQIEALTVADNVATLTFKHHPLTGGSYQQAHVDDFKAHFPGFNQFLSLAVASRFANDRKQAYLWLQAESNWGKSFLLGCLSHHGLVVETSVSELDKMFGGGPVGKTLSDFFRAWVLAVDEFKGVTREIKQITDTLPFSPKGMPTIRAPLYLKAFLSAEDVPSLVGSDGLIEDQFANRFTRIMAEGRLSDRAEFLADKGAYRQSIINYIAAYINKEFERYVAMGKGSASNAGDQVIAKFYATHRIDIGNHRIDDKLEDLAEQFVEWVMGCRHRGEPWDTLAGNVHRQDREIAGLVEQDHKTGTFFLRKPGVAFEMWLESEFDRSQRGTIAYKKDRIFRVMGGVSPRRVNITRQKYLALLVNGKAVS